MDNEIQPEKPKRGRRPRSASASIDSSKLKSIELDNDLQELINKKSSSAPLEIVRVKLPASVLAELKINIDSLNATANTQINVDKYVSYALELANESLSEILKKHLTR